ncbi:MAG: tRNA pseudouridine(55) synthase TruB, partial [Dialister sp.]|nr:tRNA pseudouridine(55) synthase TruB [Dialister sp.]
EADPEGALMTDLRPLLSALPLLALHEKEAADFLLGKRLRTREKPVEAAAAFCGSRFLGTASVERGVIHPKKVFN